MKELVEKFRQIEEIMATEKGSFDLFALFLRDDASAKWDVVVASEWLEQNKESSLKYIAENIQNKLTKEELLKLSRIVVIEEDNPSLDALHKVIHIEHGDAEIQNSDFFGLEIKHGFIITSYKRESRSIV